MEKASRLQQQQQQRLRQQTDFIEWIIVCEDFMSCSKNSQRVWDELLRPTYHTILCIHFLSIFSFFTPLECERCLWPRYCYRMKMFIQGRKFYIPFYGSLCISFSKAIKCCNHVFALVIALYVCKCIRGFPFAKRPWHWIHLIARVFMLGCQQPTPF